MTHGLTFLHQTDLIVVLNGGEIREMGTYEHLISMNGILAELIFDYLTVLKDVDDKEGKLPLPLSYANCLLSLRRQKIPFFGVSRGLFRAL